MKRREKDDAATACDRPVALVGMMGVGKTTIGRRLAARLGVSFHDADEEIQKAAGMSVSDLFAAHGEESFRRGEAKVIARLLDGAPKVLATGGGAVLDPETRRLLKEKAITVWIRADVETLYRRTTKRDTRPLLRTDDPRATIARLLEARTPYYSEADIVIDSMPGPHQLTVDAILDAVAALEAARTGKAAP